MTSYCLKCRKDTGNINPRVSNTRNGRKTILSKCAICGSKKSRFIRNQEAVCIVLRSFRLICFYIVISKSVEQHLSVCLPCILVGFMLQGN